MLRKRVYSHSDAGGPVPREIEGQKESISNKEFIFFKHIEKIF